MRIKETDVMIDDFTIKDTTYIAKDGKEFHFEHSCIKHETELDIKHIPFKKVSCMGYEHWYYLSSIEDFEALKRYITIVVQENTGTDFHCNFNKKNINDWVSYEIIYYDDDVDSCILTSFKATQKDFEEIKKDFKELEKTLNTSMT